jgi:hypothetical protein
VGRIHVPQDGVQESDLLITVLDIWIPEKWGGGGERVIDRFKSS